MKKVVLFFLIFLPLNLLGFDRFPFDVGGQYIVSIPTKIIEIRHPNYINKKGEKTTYYEYQVTMAPANTIPYANSDNDYKIYKNTINNVAYLSGLGQPRLADDYINRRLHAGVDIMIGQDKYNADLKNSIWEIAKQQS